MALTEETTLSHTPTYQAAAVVILFAGISIVVEKILHRLGAYLKRKKRRHLFNALERIKEELMLLGFISILLTLFSTEIAKICVPFSKSNPMLFCKYESYSSNSTAHESNTQESHNTENASSPSPSSSESTSDSHSPPTGRRLLETFVMSSLTNPSLSSLPSSPSRLFARKLMSSEASTCKEGYESFVNTEGLHQLHNFIFFIAVFQVLYAVLTMFLAIVRIHTWKEWEEEAKALSIACVEKDIKARFNSFYTRRSSSVGRLTSVFSFGISKSKKDEVMHEIEKPDSSCCHSFLKKITTFLQCSVEQYYASITKREYFVLRMAFITNHNTKLDFDFHNYILRCTESDFVHIVGVSWYVWVCVVILLLLDVAGWNAYFWVSFIPAIVSFLIGAKLKLIMKTVSQERDGVPVVCVDKNLKLDDALFWFDKPKLILVALHYMLFQNAFEVSTFIWLLIEFGATSCFIDKFPFLILRLLLSVFVQFSCGYFTLPLYAIATQMGSHYKSAIFSAHVSMKLTQWAEIGKEKSKLKSNSNSGIFSKMKQKMKHGQSSESLNEDLESRDLVKTGSGRTGTGESGLGVQEPKGGKESHDADMYMDVDEKDIEALDRKYNIDHGNGSDDDDFDMENDKEDDMDLVNGNLIHSHENSNNHGSTFSNSTKGDV